jgi:hypothetical protein
MELAIVFKRNFGTNVKEQREKMRSVQDRCHWFRDQGGHVLRQDGTSCTVVEHKRYCDNDDRSNEMSMTVLAHVIPKVGLNSSTRVLGGYSLLITAVLSGCKDTKRRPLYLIVG